ncbi:Prp18 domain-containing protein, partial [Helicosporidium sp. ATCC 50920]
EARARLRGGAESQPPRGEGSSRAREGVPGAAKLGAAKPGAEDASASASSGADGALEASTTPEQERLARAFAVAAAKVQRASLPIEDRLSVWVKGLCADWEADLEGRSSDSKATPSGRQATVRFAETQQYFKPLHARLRRRDLEPEMVASLKLIMDAVEERNYLHAYKIYMGLAVGNSPWPIGVTQVGLHERSAREKISFNSNMTKAHIMNDEATRKFIQALKRLMTFAQRRYPTDPSRSVDFNGFEDSSRGAFGGGSDRLALLEAMKQGADVCPAPSPSVVDETGGVNIPMRWEHQIRGALAQVSASRETEKAQP